MQTEPRQFRVSLRGDYYYITINGVSTGPSFTSELEAVRYANMLNKANRYPLLPA